jgi:hypothetical protein
MDDLVPVRMITHSLIYLVLFQPPTKHN